MMKIIKRNGTGTIEKFKNKDELLDFAIKIIERGNIIENKIQEKIIYKCKSLTIDEIIGEIDYKRV